MEERELGTMETPAPTTVHEPVLLAEVLHYLAPCPGGRYVDATFGGGGHARAILEASAPDGRLLAIDADPAAVARAEALAARYPGRLVPCHGNFRDLASLARRHGFDPADGILFDLGLSSDQLADPARGFSFQQPGPLDMRFDPTQGEPAAVIVNTWPEEQLTDLFWRYGEESRARAIARAIVAERARRPIETTTQLAELVERVVGRRRERIHPATRVFQALRIAVNRELDVLELALEQAVALLRPGGRLVVIAFHSLEDRIVKHFFRREAARCLCPPGTPVCVCGHVPRLRVLTPRAVRPAAEEIARNPRSRSARLRAAERV
ncbi:16S rRNA (cytosine(1402)-N(4))-methyltransferase RsmH [Thermomicrobium sp. 4228-Ro]|uniref:16S rRNA (cytosine(1402)-N(4))-methyltransferase RsmH n=1 Tax=Thermomicrobium sp. 4228-Ro TaxID=2993937 RepID=UPI002248D64B|nr:16S rRNA (cytosine(1402)-N(4))-methyltransferase RsmH [Thermomicrobium sp. 4228-Ro]MCX2727287.1 16S rRNA (cytosine(1402)-N(4))-methyltransferase RsmH [Thermomicrobium sp. 4228-Ro]